MPLDPKQLPPYYTPGTQGTIDNKYTRLNTQYAPIATSGTSETDLYTYTIPANTLTQNGDTIQIKFTCIKTGINDPLVIQFYINGTSQMTKYFEIPWLTWDVQIIRISTTQVQVVYQATPESGQDSVEIQTTAGLDFTATIPIKFTAEAATGDSGQTYQQTTSMQKQSTTSQNTAEKWTSNTETIDQLSSLPRGLDTITQLHLIQSKTDLLVETLTKHTELTQDTKLLSLYTGAIKSILNKIEKNYGYINSINKNAGSWENESL